MKDFRKLMVWERAHALTLNVYGETSTFPREERYGLARQMRRAAVSIPANIAEGCGRSGERELARFLDVSMGSASELEYEILLARDLKALSRERHDPLARQITEVKRMLAALIRKLRADDRRSSNHRNAAVNHKPARRPSSARRHADG
jgi:four helix bundle protein